MCRLNLPQLRDHAFRVVGWTRNNRLHTSGENDESVAVAGAAGTDHVLGLRNGLLKARLPVVGAGRHAHRSVEDYDVVRPRDVRDGLGRAGLDRLPTRLGPLRRGGPSQQRPQKRQRAASENEPLVDASPVSPLRDEQKTHRCPGHNLVTLAKQEVDQKRHADRAARATARAKEGRGSRMPIAVVERLFLARRAADRER